MFSQWRHAVENLTQHPPKTSHDMPEDTVRASTDSTSARAALPPSQLADSALLSLRKTLITQRPASPVAKASNPTPETTPRSRTTLEDRLRARFVVGEASGGTSPSHSTKPSPTPSPIPVFDHPLSPSPPAAEAAPTATDEPKEPLSPKSTPLPDSPVVLPTILSPIPLAAVTAHPLSPPPENDSGTTDVALGETSDVMMEEESHHEGTEGAQLAEEPQPREVQTSDDVVHDLGGSTVEPPMISVTQSPPPQDGAESEHTVGGDEQSTAAKDLPQTIEPQQPGQSELIPSVAEPALATNGSADDLIETPAAVPNGHLNSASTKTEEVDIEALQQRLKLVEQRFSDVSTSFKRLQAEKTAADRLLREMTPIESIQEVDSLRDFFQNMNLKTEMAQDEIKRLTGKLTRQEERIEELRDIHRLESKSQLDQIHKLQAQISETEALFKAGQSSSQQAEEDAKRRQGEIEKLRAEMEKMKGAARDEEEKRVKAISLLKTVRQKLVKAEKDRDDALRDLHKVRDQEKDELEKSRLEKQRLQDEIEKVNDERETAVQGLRAQFDKEIASLKERQEKELTALRGQYELEVITLKSLHTKEIEGKSSRIAELETSLRVVTHDKDEIFDQLQLRQAELESSQSHLESLQSQTTELQYQLREAADRVALLNEELAEAHKVQIHTVSSSTPSAEVTQLLSAAESKYESRIADLRRQLSAVERERDEVEADFTKKLTIKAKEIDHLKSIIGRSAQTHEEEEEAKATLRKEIETLRDASAAYERLVAELQMQIEQAAEDEAQIQAQVAEAKAAMAAVAQQLEESKSREAQARANNKTLRDELRKVQSSAALLERQRNPGVGYWASKTESTTDLRSPASSTSELPSTPRAESPSSKNEEEVNFEYLRNVILQFLEHKEMRPHLVRILSTILRFTPQETRRLISKV